MSKFFKVFSVTLAVGFLSTTLVFAKYAGGPVSGGGTISGKVSFKGAQPGPKEFKLANFPQPEFCGKADSKDGKRLRQDIRVTDGGLGDVVVAIEKIDKGKPFGDIDMKVVADNCRFLIADEKAPSRAVGVIVNAKKTGLKPVLKVKNLDADPSDPKTAAGILHNPHGYDIKGAIRKTIFNKPVPKQGQEITIKVNKRWFKKSKTFMLVECDQHNYMNIWALPVSNPYYAVVNSDGTYSIGDVPPGKYKLLAFHQKLGFKSIDITVAGGATATGNFEFAAK